MTTDFIVLDTEEEYEEKLWMTRVEYTRVLAARTMQIMSGAKPNIDATGMYDAMEIARKELEAGVCPIIVTRIYPDGTRRDILAGDMHINIC